MRRYETRIDDGVLYVEGPDGRLEVGQMDDIVELVGGETYVVEYDSRQQTAAWLDTDDEGRLEFDVRQTIAEYSFDEEFVAKLASADAGPTDDGFPGRVVFFADAMARIWDPERDLEEA